MQQGFNHVDKLDLLEVYPEAQKQAFSMNNIKNGFRATGLVPYNAEPAHEAEKHPVQASPRCNDYHIIGHKQL